MILSQDREQLQALEQLSALFYDASALEAEESVAEPSRVSQLRPRLA